MPISRWSRVGRRYVTKNEYFSVGENVFFKGVIFKHEDGLFKGKWSCLLFNPATDLYVPYAPPLAKGIIPEVGLFHTFDYAKASFNSYLNKA